MSTVSIMSVEHEKSFNIFEPDHYVSLQSITAIKETFKVKGYTSMVLSGGIFKQNFLNMEFTL